MPQTFSDYLNRIATEKNNTTSNRYRRDLAVLFALGFRQGVYEGFHPMIGVEPLPEDPATRYMQPATGIAAVRLGARSDERDFIECIYLLAARRGEVIRVTYEEVNFENWAVRLWPRKRRGGTLRPTSNR